MKRREVLKTVPFLLGSTIATPTLLQLLSSCSEDQHLQWTPRFLSVHQAFAVEQIVNIILPQTNTVGALEVYVPQFLDLLFKEVVSKDDQETFFKGASIFQQKFKNLFKREISKANTEEINKMVSMYFDIDEEDQKKVLELVTTSTNHVDSETYYIYKYLYSIRYYTLFAYFTTQEVKEELLGFNPYLGSYIACASL